MTKIYRKVKKKKQPSIFLPVTLAIIGAVVLCFASQAYDASQKQPKPTKKSKVEEVVLYKPSVLKLLPQDNSLACDSKCFKKKKREQNNMTKEQRDKAFAELFNN